MRPAYSSRWKSKWRAFVASIGGQGGSEIVEFAITVPLLTVMIVGIFDFSGALNLHQKISSAAQEGATTAASQPTLDLSVASPPPSIQATETTVLNYLINEKVVGLGCTGSAGPPTNLTWTYTLTGCPDTLTIQINRGFVFPTGANAEKVIATQVTVTYPYHWRFNSVIQLVAPGATYFGTTQVTESATAGNML